MRKAIKTYSEKVSYPKKRVVEKEIDLFSLKCAIISSKEDERGVVYSLPDYYVECIAIDSMDNGKHKATMTMLSKSAEMLELLMKVVFVSFDEEEKFKDKVLLKEIKTLLKQIID